MRNLLASQLGISVVCTFMGLVACSDPEPGVLAPLASGGLASGGVASNIVGNGGSSAATTTAAGGSMSGGSLARGGSSATSTTTLGGMNGSGGASSAAGGRASGGAGVGGSANGGTTTLGGTSAGGTSSKGGSSARGGSMSGGSSNQGGRSNAGGASNVGGKSSVGGTTNAGGTSNVGGTSNAGGNTSSAGGTTSGTDGCTNTLALGLTIGEIAVFQSGKISIMKSGSAVTATTKNGGAVIEGRPTLFRVYVTTDSGFQSRQLSARLTVNGGSTPYYAKQTIAASSTELSATNSFLINVPASEIKSGLEYSVQIVECATGSGTSHDPQFPSSGTQAIATRATGVINLTLLPVTANGITPDLTGLSTSLKAHLEAVYPTSTAQITVANTAITGCGVTPSLATDGTSWSNCLNLVRSRRSADKPANDMYYMGVITPADTYANFCRNACIAGVGFVSTSTTAATTRAAIALGYNPQGLGSIAHELGHNHGLNHSPGCGADSADAAFPYITNGTAMIGWVGWDNRKPTSFLDPARYTDMMAYCDPIWISDYVYGKFANRIAALNGAALLQGPNAVATWRVLDVIEGKASWGTPLTDPTPAFGAAESGVVYDVQGYPVAETTVYRTDSSLPGNAMYIVPEPESDWARIQIGSVMADF